MESPHQLIEQIERLIRRDPARRGLIGSEPTFGPLCVGHLAAAASHLAEFGTHVAIVTGFFVPHGQPPAAETDGPLGALLLATALTGANVDTVVLTDRHCIGTLLAAAEAAGFPPEQVMIYSDDSLDEFCHHGFGSRITHLIAIERVGPSHTLDSLRQQPRNSEPPLQDFQQSVPAEARNRCHNMRGRVIDEHTASVHRLFEDLQRFRPQAKTIGIGDGANEIGMGAVPWEELVRRLDGDWAGRIPCRIATDWNIVAGTSNWGAYALTACTLLLQDRTGILRDWDREHQQRILHHIVQNGPAVDGVTGRQEETVDGLPFLTYIQPWEGMRRLLGLDE